MSRLLVLAMALDTFTFTLLATLLPLSIWELNPVAVAIFSVGGIALCVILKMALAIAVALLCHTEPSRPMHFAVSAGIMLTLYGAWSNTSILYHLAKLAVT